MIAVDDSQKDREAPAKSLVELLERISIYAGRFLKIEVSGAQSVHGYGYSTQDYIAVGKLVALQFSESARGVYVYMDPERTTAREIKLTSTVSVLTDGGWVSIHEPERKSQR